MPGDFGGSQLRSEEIPHNLVVALAVHPQLHGFAGLDSEAPVVRGPSFSVRGIRIDDHAIHVENQCQTRLYRHMPDEFNSLSNQFK